MEEKYEVIHNFKDLEDNNHLYIANKDIYPREGLEPTKKRIKELTTEKNKIGKAIIKKIEEEVKEENENVETENTEEVKEETEVTE